MSNDDGTINLRSQSSNLDQVRDDITAAFAAGGPRRGGPSLRSDRLADDAALDKRVASESPDPGAARAGLLARLRL